MNFNPKIPLFLKSLIFFSNFLLPKYFFIMWFTWVPSLAYKVKLIFYMLNILKKDRTIQELIKEIKKEVDLTRNGEGTSSSSSLRKSYIQLHKFYVPKTSNSIRHMLHIIHKQYYLYLSVISCYSIWFLCMLLFELCS